MNVKKTITFVMIPIAIISVLFCIGSCKVYDDIPNVSACYRDGYNCISYTDNCYGEYVIKCPEKTTLLGICRNINNTWADLYYYSPGFNASSAQINCSSNIGKWESH